MLRILAAMILFLYLPQAYASEPKLPIHENTTGFQNIPAFQPPKLCNQARKDLADDLGYIRLWFAPVLHGSSSERLILSDIAVRVQDKLLSIGRRAEMAGLEKYRRNRVQTSENNGDKNCYEYITKWRVELARVMNIVQTEAYRGNRALQETGIEQFLKGSH